MGLPKGLKAAGSKIKSAGKAIAGAATSKEATFARRLVFDERPFVQLARGDVTPKNVGLAAFEVATLYPGFKAAKGFKAARGLPVASRLAVAAGEVAGIGGKRIVYHGTTEAAARSIARTGFKASEAAGAQLPGVFASESLKFAKEYSGVHALAGMSKTGRRIMKLIGRTPAIVAGEIPKGARLASERNVTAAFRATGVRASRTGAGRKMSLGAMGRLKKMGFAGARGDLYWPELRPQDVVIFDPKSIRRLRPVRTLGTAAVATLGVKAARQASSLPAGARSRDTSAKRSR